MTRIKAPNWIRTCFGEVQRVEACYEGQAYAPHAHGGYGLAITTQGVQSFNYRGVLRHSLPGNVVVLHPGEKHDGQAGSEQPFVYRGMFIDTADVQEILGGYGLPFLAGGVAISAPLVSVAKRALEDLARPLDKMEYQEILHDFAHIMRCIENNKVKHTTVNFNAMKLAREYICDSLDSEITLEKLAEITGYSKWQITKDFRSLYGESPYRYLISRRLSRAKEMLEQGRSVAFVANELCFSDQSHFTRQFKKCFGITPFAWQQLIIGH